MHMALIWSRQEQCGADAGGAEGGTLTENEIRGNLWVSQLGSLSSWVLRRFLFVFTLCISRHVYVCTTYMPGALRGLKREPDPLDIMWVTGYQSLTAPCFEIFFFLRQDLTTYSLSLELRNICLSLLCARVSGMSLQTQQKHGGVFMTWFLNNCELILKAKDEM